MKTFEELDLTPRLSLAIKDLGYKEPTQIQYESIPHILAGKDVIGESATGSGKTLAFGCGIVENAVPGKGIQALVLTPTRELAEQVKESLREFSGEDHLTVVAVYGGTLIFKQIKSLKKADVVVATPGRLLDHIRHHTIDLGKVNLLVLDEADRMFDMGFIDDVEKIIKKCPKERQTLFFSATISARVNGLAGRHMIDPVKVFAEKMVEPEKLRQVYYDVPKGMKLTLLTHLLQNEDTHLAMVFCNTRRTADFVARNLRSYKLKAVVIHGGLSQKARTRTINAFNNAEENVLVCTDVAARGLHIENVSHIYNFEAPLVANDYVHRIGRTARAGEEGKVINLLCKMDKKYFDKIRSRYPGFVINNVHRPKLAQLKMEGNKTPQSENTASSNESQGKLKKENRAQRKKRQRLSGSENNKESHKRAPENTIRTTTRRTGPKHGSKKTGHKPRKEPVLPTDNPSSDDENNSNGGYGKRTYPAPGKNNKKKSKNKGYRGKRAKPGRNKRGSKKRFHRKKK